MVSNRHAYRIFEIANHHPKILSINQTILNFDIRFVTAHL
jgi:hypothetical protein